MVYVCFFRASNTSKLARARRNSSPEPIWWLSEWTWHSVICMAQFAHFKRERWLIKGNKYITKRIWSLLNCQKMGCRHPHQPLIPEQQNMNDNRILRELLQSTLLGYGYISPKCMIQKTNYSLVNYKEDTNYFRTKPNCFCCVHQPLTCLAVYAWFLCRSIWMLGYLLYITCNVL